MPDEIARQNYRISWTMIDSDGDSFHQRRWALLSPEETLKARQIMGIAGDGEYVDLKFKLNDANPPQMLGLDGLLRYFRIRNPGI
jgi:hypothetical protein